MCMAESTKLMVAFLQAQCLQELYSIFISQYAAHLIHIHNDPNQMMHYERNSFWKLQNPYL